ncbi:hypothetical protein ACQJBY_015164 [Aegilops geniculata]
MQLSDCNSELVSLVVPTNQGFSTKLIWSQASRDSHPFSEMANQQRQEIPATDLRSAPQEGMLLAGRGRGILSWSAAFTSVASDSGTSGAGGCNGFYTMKSSFLMNQMYFCVVLQLIRRLSACHG